MDPDRTLYALVARKIPVIWDVVGPASLNPQPLPPLEVPQYVDPLNPQPLPPGPPPEVYGATVGRELVRLQWQASKLQVTLPATSTWADDPAPTPPGRPSLPPWLPQVTEPNQAWLEGYYLGLACALAVAPEAVHESGFAADVFDRATTALASLGAPPTAAQNTVRCDSVSALWQDGGTIVATGTSFATRVDRPVKATHPHLTPFQVEAVLHAVSRNAQRCG